MATFSERVPPQNLEAEQSVLGAMLIDRDAITTVAGVLTAADFYAERHGRLFEAITALYQRGEPVDLVTVQEELRRRGQHEAVGGLPYLTSLMNTVPTTANVGQYAQIVENKAILRRLQTTSRQTAEACYEAEDADAALADAQRAILSLAQGRNRRGPIVLQDALVSFYQSVEARYNTVSPVPGRPTGFRDLDRLTGGLQDGDMIVVAARPSVGKTAFTLNLARNAMVQGGARVGFFSLEMSVDQLVQRLVAAEAAVDSARIRTGKLLDQDWQRLGSAMATLSGGCFVIDDTPNYPLPNLLATARRIVQQHDLNLLFVDYLQLMSIPSRSGPASRQQEISDISRGLKGLAKELRIPLIAVSQLSRSVEQRQDKHPLLSDLRESGAIEQDADLVAFLYREDYYEPDTERKNLVEVILAKHRNGPTGTVELYFMKEIQKMVGMEFKAP